MLDARLSKSSLFFGGGLDLDTHSLAGGVSAVPGPSDHGVILDFGHSDSAQLAGIQDDSVHSAGVAGIVDSGNGGNALIIDTGFSDPSQHAGIQDDSVHSAAIESKGMVSLLPTIDHSGQASGIPDASLTGSDKGFEDLGLREGISGASLTESDKGFEDLGLQKGSEVPTLSVDHVDKAGTDPAALLCNAQEAKPNFDPPAPI
jgi:hypothetical protein